MAPRVLCETQTQSTTPAAPRMNRRKLLLARTAQMEQCEAQQCGIGER